MRPQQQRMRKQRELLGSLDIGDTIATAGGLIGRIVELSDERALIEVGDGVHIEFLRAAITRKVEESTSPYYETADYDTADYDTTDHGAGDHDTNGGSDGEHGTGEHSTGEHDDAGATDHSTDHLSTEGHHHTTEGPDTPEQEKQ
jgi:preprotein translocase YajC subunit